jgi:D-alanyl-D-alanine carboxypeptidase
MPSRSALLASLTLVATTANAFAQVNEASFKKLDALFSEQVSKKKSPSYSVAVVQHGKVVYAKGFGMANLEDDVAATPSTVYRIGSITKQFTATMIMQLVKEGKLRVDDPFENILPEMPKAWAKVTVKNLLNHTSGIKSYTEIPDLFAGDAMKPTNPAGIIKTVESSPMDFEPGAKWHYNNTGYELLGMIIEKLDKRPYADSLKARILTPLGMDHTYFTSESKVVPHRAQGYSWEKITFEHAHYLNMDWPYAAGSIESTVLDLAKWDAALYGEGVLPHAMLEQMWAPTNLTNGTTQKYGFGWQVDTMNGSPIVMHGGGIHGFTTFIRRSPTVGITVIVLTNSDGASNPEGLATEAMGIVEPSLKKPEAKVEADTNPATTKHDQAILQSVLEGNFDRKTLTPEFAEKLTPELLSTAKVQLAALGKLKKISFVKEQVIETLKSRIYKATFENAELNYAVATDKDGLIGGLEIHQ